MPSSDTGRNWQRLLWILSREIIRERERSLFVERCKVSRSVEGLHAYLVTELAAVLVLFSSKT